jgi:NAD(P)H dehydrogenase (quinone)
MKALIVYAHEEPKSFNAALLKSTVDTLSGMGMTVTVSDLYAMNFDPVGGKRDFTTLHEPDYFKYAVEQTHATTAGTFVPELAAEHKKLLEADLLLFQFPLWWFGLPAILKGWVDRVFAAGLIYGGGKWYSNGIFQGKRAMLCLTTGGPANMYSPRGLSGDIDTILYPIQHGMLYFVGYGVLPPMVCWSAARVSDEKRAEYLAQYQQRLLAWQTTPVIPFHPLSDYDQSMQLKQS